MTQPVHENAGQDVRLHVIAPTAMLADMHRLEDDGLDRYGIALMTGMPIAWVHVLMGPYLPRMDSGFKH